MLIQIHVEEGIDVKVEIVRRPAPVVQQQSVPQHVVIKQEKVDDQSALAAPAQQPQVEAKPSTNPTSKGAAGSAEPVLLYVGSRIQGPSHNKPAKVKAGAWVTVNTGSPGLRLMSNIALKSPEVTEQLADMASVYAALSDPELQVLMRGKKVLHIVSGVKRTVELLHTAEGNSKQFETVVAGHIRSIAAAAPYKVFFMHEPRTRRGTRAAGLRQACGAADSCSKHQRTCVLLAQHA